MKSDFVVVISRQLAEETLVERAGFLPMSRPTLADIREREHLRVQQILASMEDSPERDDLIRQVHQAADQLAMHIDIGISL